MRASASRTTSPAFAPRRRARHRAPSRDRVHAAVLDAGRLAHRQEQAESSDSDVRCLDGQRTEPYEQNTQQSPGRGRSSAPQAVHA
ncbi:hypothetical protein WS70_22475 [Burkholderia mayonis]|uniref:Uncharacterized protein n=1 Tax=Burkholderia mayonis TaxID=1385591 RepID=A0A1B4FLN1_9BURK|nr:hypothetical protein WS70_22475 [Burkholderia mayonis]KVE34576.1 hypothetical protein WS69_16885 [Burkholderia sp. BDU5]